MQSFAEHIEFELAAVIAARPHRRPLGPSTGSSSRTPIPTEAGGEPKGTHAARGYPVEATSLHQREGSDTVFAKFRPKAWRGNQTIPRWGGGCGESKWSSGRKNTAKADTAAETRAMSDKEDPAQGAEFVARTCFPFSSILIPPLPAQDRSHIAILELGTLPGTPPPKLDPGGLREIGEKLWHRMAEGWARLLEVLKDYRAALEADRHTARGADTFGTLLACAVSRRPLTALPRS